MGFLLSDLPKGAVLGILLLALLAVPVSGSMSAPMNARDLTGTNMPGIDHFNTPVNSAQECAELCAATAGCEGATYVLPNTIQGPNAHCWRKSAVTGDVENFNCISFVRQSAPSGGGCSGVTPIADFSAFPVSGLAPYSVQFTDQSTGAVSWTWDFGDLTSGPENSQQNPLHTYTTGNAQGLRHEVKLTITGTCPGQSDMKTRVDYVAVYDNIGMLDLTSVPSGARAYLDSDDLGTTPYKSMYMAGSYTLRLTMSGYNDYTAPVTIVKNQQNKVTATMVKVANTTASAAGTLQITTTPDGAAVYVDGGSKGMSPLTLSGLAAGSHTVKLTKTGYTDYQATVTVIGGQTTPLNVMLVAGTGSPSGNTTTGVPTVTGSVSVSSTPSGASVDLDGWDKGTTPVTIEQVKAGSHTLTLKKTGYQNSVQTVTITGGSTTPVNVQLVPQDQPPQLSGSGTLTVSSIPGGASVYLDGGKIGTTPVTAHNVTAGTHNLILTLQNYNDISRTVEITSGSEKEVSIDFSGVNNSPGFPLSLVLAAGALIAVVLLIVLVMRGKKKDR
jgi:PKD repeat protein